MERRVVALVERDAVFRDVHKEIAAVREAVVHLLQRVHDEVHRGLQRLGDAILAHQLVLGLLPVGDTVGEALVVDDDEQVEVGFVALGGVRLVDPAAARVAAVEHDLEDAALLLPCLRGERGGFLEACEQNLEHALKLALLGGRQMIEVGAHRRPS